MKLISIILVFFFVMVSGTPATTSSDFTTNKINSVLTDNIIEVTLRPVDIECLALNLYFESATESTAGKLAVANVTINRLKSSRYPDSICGVVKQSKTYFSVIHNKLMPLKNKCQFSWYCNGISDVPTNEKVYNEILLLSEHIIKQHITGNLIDISDSALFYHASYVKPNWSSRKTISAIIDNHIFYK